MVRDQRYLEKTEYIQFNLDTPLTFPSNGQHQRKTGRVMSRIERSYESGPPTKFTKFIQGVASKAH